MRPDYRDCFQPFLQPGERLIAASNYWPNSALPSVPAQLRTPRTPPPPSALEQRVRGALGSVLGKVSRPLEAMGSSRVVNNPLIRTADRVSDRVENAAIGLAGGEPGRQALTDRRLILLVDHNTSWRNPTPQWDFGVAVPRTNIARLTAHSKVISKGRFDAAFVDGSWIALGSLQRERMEGFVATFDQGV
ncbi:hypothetical protein [Streptomyces sp. NPDC015125]|uniref:hypothetical protein n=1 Tax=Streptomyces sp. NPDC015125 TaxID=3364938 RepID=UPI00370314B1